MSASKKSTSNSIGDMLLSAQVALLSVNDIDSFSKILADTLEGLPGVLASRVCLRMAASVCEGLTQDECTECQTKLPIIDPLSECKLGEKKNYHFFPLATKAAKYGGFSVLLDENTTLDTIENSLRNFSCVVVAQLQARWQDAVQKAEFVASTNDENGAVNFYPIENLLNDGLILGQSPGVAFSSIVTDIWRPIYVSENAERVLGYSASELLNETPSYFDILHPDDADQVVAEVEAIVSDKVNTAFILKPYRIVRKDGKIRWVEESINIVRSPSGDDIRYEGIVLDCSKRIEGEKELEDALASAKVNEDRYQALYENLPVCIHELDLNGQMLSVNQAGVEMLGLSRPEDIIGSSYMNTVAEEDRDRVNSLLQSAIGGNITSFTFASATKSEPQWLNSCLIPTFNHDGTVSNILGVCVDITHQYAADEHLKKAVEILSLTSKVAKIGSWSLDLLSNDLYWSEETKNIHEVPQDYVPSLEEAIRFYHSDDQQQISVAVERAIASGTPFDIELRIVTASNQTKWIRAVGQTKKLGGNVTSIFGTFQDIDAWMQISLSGARLGKMADQAGDMMALVNADFQYIAVNDAYCNAFGKEKSDFLGLTVAQIFGQKVFDEVRGSALRSMGGESIRWQEWVDYPTLGRRYVDIIRAPYSENATSGTGYVISARDITEMELARIELESFLGEANERVKEALCMLNITEAMRVSTELSTLLQDVATSIPSVWKSPETLACQITFGGETFGNSKVSSSEPVLTSEIVVKGRSRGRVCLSLLTKESEKQRRDFLNQEQELLDGIAAMLSIAVVEHETALYDERLLTAIEQSSESIVITDSTGSIEYVNSSFEKSSGYTREETIGENPRVLNSGEQPKIFYEDMWKKLSAGIPWHGKFVNRRKNGSLYTETAIITPIRDKSGNISHYVAAKRDISNEIKLEEQLRHAQKMESVGHLAGGVAHDFNNMLGVIVGHAEIAISRLKPGEENFSELTEIMNAAQKSANLTKQLLMFARKQTIQPRILKLNEMIGGLLTMLNRLIGENIELTWTAGKEEMRVHMDPTQIDQFLTNLVVNAREAIGGESGKIEISSYISQPDPDNFNLKPEEALRTYACLTVSDDGQGMTQEILDHIFEPFFTPKPPGGSTGLGLATVFGIIKQNEGFVDVKSKPNFGTTFRVFLPLNANTSAPSLNDSGISHQLKPELTTPFSILLVEDERALLEMTKMMLELMGHNVTAASRPLEAIKIAQARESNFDLLITDVIMPEMDGGNLAKKLQEDFPHLKCLFMSGYTRDAIAPHGVLEEGILLIEKPFVSRTLRAAIQEVLSQPA